MALLDTRPAAPEAEAAQEAVEGPLRPVRACPACGSLLELDQLACLECGHIARSRSGLIPAGWQRRVGLASMTALLVSMCAGLGVSAAFQGGGKLPKTVAAAPKPITSNPVIPPPPAPPAPATPAPAAKPAAPAAPAAPAKPAATTPAGGSHAAPGSSTGSASSPGTAGVGTGAATTPAQPGGGQPPPFPNGVTPGAAYLLDANDQADHPNAVSKIIDGDARTSWSTGAPFTHPVGVWLDAGAASTYSQLGILSKGPSFAVTIYGSNGNSAPSAPPTQAGSGWTQLSQSYSVQSGKNKIALSYPNGAERYYLIWITAVSGQTATIAETAFLG